MLSLDYIADYIESKMQCTTYVGKLYSGGSNNANTNVIAIYNTKSEQHTAIGGHRSYNYKGFKILVHCNKNYAESERFAFDAYELFADKRININELECIMQPRYSEPICVGTDNYGIWEFVVDVVAIYKEV